MKMLVLALITVGLLSGPAIAGSCTNIKMAIAMVQYHQPNATVTMLTAEQLTRFATLGGEDLVLGSGAWFAAPEKDTIYVIGTIKGCVRFARTLSREDFDRLVLGLGE